MATVRGARASAVGLTDLSAGGSGRLLLARDVSSVDTLTKSTRCGHEGLVIHGAGMNMRGKVQTEVFGKLTLPEYDVKIREYAGALGSRSRSSTRTSRAR